MLLHDVSSVTPEKPVHRDEDASPVLWIMVSDGARRNRKRPDEAATFPKRNPDPGRKFDASAVNSTNSA
jgi:hypothetical protein